jgi:NAD(P)-dependent dehydrogenase (short-subunit alcohol dehydrogenase family)
MFQSVVKLDAVVSAAGQAKFASLDELTDADYQFSFSNKLMGQVNLMRIGRQFIAGGGSFTFASGVLSHEPMKGSVSISMVNAGLEGFVRAAALELPRGVRVNVVSPPWVTETLIRECSWADKFSQSAYGRIEMHSPYLPDCLSYDACCPSILPVSRRHC